MYKTRKPIRLIFNYIIFIPIYIHTYLTVLKDSKLDRVNQFERVNLTSYTADVYANSYFHKLRLKKRKKAKRGTRTFIRQRISCSNYFLPLSARFATTFQSPYIQAIPSDFTESLRVPISSVSASLSALLIIARIRYFV